MLITTNTTHAANEHLYKKLPYDPVKDFAPVTGLGKGSQVLVVKADAPYRTVTELLAAARQKPGKLSFGSGSSSSRVAGELFQQMSGTEILHVPYKSNPMAITDLLGGQIDLMITDMSTGVPQIKGGKLRALGVSTLKRSSLLPDVPTIAEADEAEAVVHQHAGATGLLEQAGGHHAVDGVVIHHQDVRCFGTHAGIAKPRTTAGRATNAASRRATSGKSAKPTRSPAS